MSILNDRPTHPRWTKRQRTVRRLAADLTAWSLYPTARVVRTFWWSDRPNFGDDLTPFLLRRNGIAPLLKPVHSADLVAVGSIIELLPAGYTGMVWGSGKMHADELTRLPEARILALRGTLTASALGIDPESIALGDPGLLISDYVARSRPTSRIGVIPHFTHQHDDQLRALADAPKHRLIDVGRSAREVAREISRCEMVFTTSLHGLIVADALGIPATWGLAEPVLAGGTFKFADYESVVNPEGRDRRLPVDSTLSAARLRRAAFTPRTDLLEHHRRALRASLATVKREAVGTDASPLTLPLRQYRA